MPRLFIGVLGTEKLEALKGSKNQADDIKAALEGLKKDSGYLFEEDKGTPPPYSFGHRRQSCPRRSYRCGCYESRSRTEK